MQSDYRPDIDGLRAIAILGVVGFHAGLPHLGGGFTGVDVFFVISGFLITGILAREQAASGRIDLINFYARRVRRLVPALVTVVLVSLALGAAFLTPVGEQQGLARSAIGAALFVANIWAWRSGADYFHPNADTLPLLHTWTLAVEEQFYIGFPLLLIAGGWIARRTGRRGASLLLTAAVAALSLALWLLVNRWREGPAFYLSPTRAWEFAAGALLALAGPSRRLADAPRAAGALALVGLALIAATFATLRGRGGLGGLFALPPVLGALAVIAGCGAAPNGLAGRLLASPPTVAIGKLSYSWYLWHWPLLAIARAASLQRDLPRDLLLSLLALGLAALTWAFVERPIRERRPFVFATRRGTLLAGAAMLATVATLSVGLKLWADQTRDASPAYMALDQAGKTRRKIVPDDCLSYRTGRPVPPAERCSFGPQDAPRAVLLYGDSHTQQLLPAMEAAAQAAQVRLFVHSSGGCKPYLATDAGDSPLAAAAARECSVFKQKVLAEVPRLVSDRGLTGVVIAVRWLPGGDWSGELGAVVQSLQAQGLTVTVVRDTPLQPFNAIACLARRPMTECSRTRADAERVRERNGWPLMKAVAAHPRTQVFDPMPYLCTDRLCPVEAAGAPLYRDENHLSHDGAMRLVAPLTGLLSGLAPQPLRQ